MFQIINKILFTIFLISAFVFPQENNIKSFIAVTFDDLPMNTKHLKDGIQWIEQTKKLKGDNDSEILLSHQPPKCIGKHGVDFIPGTGNVGNENYDKIMNGIGIKFSLSGHIHEAGGNGVTGNGQYIKPNKFSDELRFNPGSAAEGLAGVFTIEGNKAKYESISSR